MEENQILLAARIAVEAHRGQKRKWGYADVPYITHPMRVAGRVAIHPRATEEMVAAAWLHDVIEDTRLNGNALLNMGVRLRAVGIVEEVTTRTQGMKASRAERKQIDREFLAKVSWEARALKLADRIDNLRETNNDKTAPQDFVQLYKAESKLLLGVLRGTDRELEDELEREIRR